MIVYLVTNKINGKKYVGITKKTLEERKYQHEYNALSERLNTHFAHAIRKYGKESFIWEVIDTANSWEELCEKEQTWISFYDSFNNGYNMTSGGEGAAGFEHSEETKKKLSEVNKGKKLSDVAKRKMSEVRQGMYTGSKHPQATLNEDDVVEIKKLLMQGIPHKEIAKQFNVTHKTIRHISANDCWCHVKVEGWDDWVATKKPKHKPLNIAQIIEIKNLLMLNFPIKIIAEMLQVPIQAVYSISSNKTGKNVHVPYWDKFIASKAGKIRNTKLSEDDVIKIKHMLMNGATIAEVAETFNVANRTISDISTGKTWSHVYLEGWEAFRESRKKKKKGA